MIKWTRFIIGILVVIIIFAGAVIIPKTGVAAVVYKLWLCDALTGGTATSLDGIHSGNSDVPNGAFAMIIPAISGVSYIQFFRFNSGATETENTTTHPYQVVPDNLPEYGVWEEVSSVSTWYSP